MDWQPARIAPATNGNPYWSAMQGKIIRVRPFPGAIAVRHPEQIVYEIHPEDWKTMEHIPGGSPLIMDFQLQMD